jgi:hypothetical protein
MYGYSTILYAKETSSKRKAPVKCFTITTELDRCVEINYPTGNGSRLSASIKGSRFLTALATICASKRFIGQVLQESDCT